MKKYRLSKSYAVCYIGAFLFMVFCFIISIPMVVYYDDEVSGLIILIIYMFASLLGAIMCAVLYFIQFPGGRFSLDFTGITMYVGFKEWFHSWEDILECGFVSTDVGDGNIYWIYFSHRILTASEKNRFLAKASRDLKNIAYFQYNPGLMKEWIAYMPQEIAAKLRWEEKNIVGNMKWTEKLYHR